MSERLSPASFKQLFLRGVVLIDVRAEVEYDRGAFPSACNIPILNSGERALVGTTYRAQGQAASIRLGHQLVQGATRAARVARWCDVVRNHPDTAVYCWRGGLRSHLAAQWMAEAGCPAPVIEGGFKALRRYLITAIDAVARDHSLFIIGGQTGAAKTPLLQQLRSGIDLEQHAHHRGSSFGRHATAPPSQIDFEHRLAIDMLTTIERYPGRELFLEDESPRIGAVSIPMPLFEAMRRAPLVIVEMPLPFRIERIYQEYVVELRREYQMLGGENAEQRFAQHLLASLERIKKRLGLARYVELGKLMQAALHSGDADAHAAWIKTLLCDYYDPMYQYQLARSESRVVFRGDYAAVLDWCRQRMV